MAKYSSDAGGPITIVKEISISAAAGSHAVNVFKLSGSVRVVDQVAEITEITTLTNCTAVYATLYDGTISRDLTADGVVLSGLPVGTMFTKDQDVTQTYSVSDASACQVNEVLLDNKYGKPFTVTAKNTADTFIRLHLTTTDDPISFKILLKFVYEPLDGGCLELLL